jgi:hypothetical protein
MTYICPRCEMEYECNTKYEYVPLDYTLCEKCFIVWYKLNRNISDLFDIYWYEDNIEMAEKVFYDWCKGKFK